MSEQTSAAAKTPILLGTSNPAKQDTLRWLVEGLPLNPVTPGQLNLHAAPEETADTHEAIAQVKAQDWSRAGSMLALASDGGLVLPALGSEWQSRYTHRFAGPVADDAHRQERLLELMRPYQGEERQASWVEALAVADRGNLLASWELQGANGIIGDRPANSPPTSGFWAFSVWYFPEFGKTYSELSLQQREELDDHWVRLRRSVHSFFQDHLGPDQ